MTVEALCLHCMRVTKCRVVRGVGCETDVCTVCGNIVDTHHIDEGYFDVDKPAAEPPADQ